MNDAKHIKNLGKTATDKAAGFTGIITAIVYYISGCTQYCILPNVRKMVNFQMEHMLTIKD